MIFDQHTFDVRFEWGERGVTLLAPISDVVIVVDVLSFCTGVEIAVSRGAIVFPYRGTRDALAGYATAVGAEVAHHGPGAAGYSLSPSSLLAINPGTRLVLPSPNGSTLSLAAEPTPVFAGCLRNARAVAAAALHLGRQVAVIAAGERWRPQGSLRPAFEDLLGAGAIIDELGGALSPEARSARAAYRQLQPTLAADLQGCISGKELIARGFAQDVTLASQLNVSDCAPRLIDGAYRPAPS